MTTPPTSTESTCRSERSDGAVFNRPSACADAPRVADQTAARTPRCCADRGRQSCRSRSRSRSRDQLNRGCHGDRRAARTVRVRGRAQCQLIPHWAGTRPFGRRQRAHSTQRRVADRATSRSNPIGRSQSSQAPNSASSTSASVRRSAAASRTAWPCSALTCARSNAIVVPSGSCSSSAFAISAAATMSSNCRASDATCSSVRSSSATSAARIARRSRSVRPRIHHAYTHE
jgi:hypothetical protein